MDYQDLYRKNCFKVGDVAFTIEDIPDRQLFFKRFAILTAWNPNNIPTNTWMNIKNNEELGKELRHIHLTFDKAIGYVGDHKEESYCVYGITLAEAIELGDKFSQYSIFYNDDTSIGYYAVGTSEPILVREKGSE